jgi:AcrR family transcriptional regulator
MDSKQQILDCAMAELDRSGAENFSLRAVGTAAGLTPMAVYRHYRDREALLAAVGEAAFAEWQRRIERIGATRPPLDWLRAAGRAYIVFALDAPAKFEACFVIRTSVERLYPEHFVDGRSPVVAMMVARIRAAQAEGVLAAGDPLETAMFYWAELHGLAMLHRSGRFTLKRRPLLALVDRMIDRMLRVA